MRIVTLEEHFIIPELTKRIDPAVIAKRGWPKPGSVPPERNRGPKLIDVGAARLADMDATGVTVQVLSMSGPGADLLEGEAGIEFARDTNDWLARVVGENPSRYAGFAHLPTTAPEAAADELERAVSKLGLCGALISGMTQNRYMDDPVYTPLLARAAELGVPIYLHPGLPSPEVRDSYSRGLQPELGIILSEPGWGWHAETAVQVIRMAVSGTFDRHPGLQVIIGHMGEMLPMMMTRLDDTFGPQAGHLRRTPSQTILDHVHITTSGFFSLAPFMAALLSFGADRIMFSVDYPFSDNAAGTAFLRGLPVAPADLHKIASGNADRLLNLD
jgi:predicted TIM-barrel fold metal-dependent hydrolase